MGEIYSGAAAVANGIDLACAGDMEDGYIDNQKDEKAESKSRTAHMNWLFGILSCLALSVGASSNILLSRFYFVHGGSHRWLATLLQTAGWPIIVLLLLVTYRTKSMRPNPITLKMLLTYSALGILLGVNNLLFSWGLSYLPASTGSLLISSQLAFNSIFSIILVRHRFNPFSTNSVMLLVFSSALLACDSGDDRPQGVSQRHYITGFLLAIAGAALNGLLLPLLQLTYKKMPYNSVTVPAVLEMQVFMCASASLFCVLAMMGSGDFKELPREVESFDVGEIKYFITLVSIAVSSQLLFLGNVALILLTSALLAGVFTSFLLPMTGILAAICFHDNFTGIKAMASLLSVWGFVSYLYGGYRESKREKESIDQQLKVSSVQLAADVSDLGPHKVQNGLELPTKH